MPRYVALIRGINLGGHTVKMDRLKKLFEELGFKNVETFIASGNVVFECASKSAAGAREKDHGSSREVARLSCDDICAHGSGTCRGAGARGAERPDGTIDLYRVSAAGPVERVAGEADELPYGARRLSRRRTCGVLAVQDTHERFPVLQGGNREGTRNEGDRAKRDDRDEAGGKISAWKAGSGEIGQGAE